MEWSDLLSLKAVGALITSLLALWQRQRISRFFSPRGALIVCESQREYYLRALLEVVENGEKAQNSPLMHLIRERVKSSPELIDSLNSSSGLPLRDQVMEISSSRSSFLPRRRKGEPGYSPPPKSDLQGE